MTEPLENLYFNWLSAKVNRLENPTPSLRYTKLLRALHNTQFVFLVTGDDNRVEDGVGLRWEFYLEDGQLAPPDWDVIPCSVLEMLIAFSRRASFATDTPAFDWFWEFIENLGLKEFNDSGIFPQRIVDNILDVFVWRKYDFRGRGGLFPLDNARHDQTETEIWYQFCDYLTDQNRMP